MSDEGSDLERQLSSSLEKGEDGRLTAILPTTDAHTYVEVSQGSPYASSFWRFNTPLSKTEAVL